MGDKRAVEEKEYLWADEGDNVLIELLLNSIAELDRDGFASERTLAQGDEVTKRGTRKTFDLSEKTFQTAVK